MPALNGAKNTTPRNETEVEPRQVNYSVTQFQVLLVSLCPLIATLAQVLVTGLSQSRAEVVLYPLLHEADAVFYSGFKPFRIFARR